ncbi:hypothetical protein [Sphingobacterium sp. R2]|uniref:hypothetical protein n=1 Tax=Sphingobacterium sp. R2 TaxID=3112958 RepID=UPI00345DC923
MKSANADTQPVLQVFLSDRMYTPKQHSDFYLSDSLPIFNFHEHVFDDATIKCHELYGRNITARFSNCFMEEEKEIYAIPAQPIVTFHIQLSADCLTRFVNEQNQSCYNELECRLFWQSDLSLAYLLPQTESDYLELYIRPSHFFDMADRHPIFRELAMEVATESQSSMDFSVDIVDQRVLNFIDTMFHEVTIYQVCDRRFTHLCECLLLQSMGISVNVEPIPKDASKRMFDSAFANLEDEVFSDEQLSSLKIITRCYNRDQLIDKFYKFKQEYLELKADRARYRMLEQEIKVCYRQVMEDSADLLAEAYFWMAKQLDEYKKIFTLSEHEEQNLAHAIITVCDQSFELRAPSGDQLKFYTGYTQRPFVGDLGMQEFGQILNMLVPDMYLPLDKLDESRESGAILNEYLQDSLSFKPLSHFTEKGEEDKPPKVVELYHTLMQWMTDELTISETGDIEKSDLIRILDHAYQQNDLIMLLMFEIEHLTGQENYVKSQKFNKISAWVMVLEDAIENWYDGPYSNIQQKLFDHLVNIYMQSGNDMKAVEHKIRKAKRIYDQMVPALLHLGNDMESLTKKNMFMLVAESLIVAATQNPFEEGEI